MLPCQKACAHYTVGCHKNCLHWRVLRQQLQRSQQAKKKYLSHYRQLCNLIERQCKAG